MIDNAYCLSSLESPKAYIAIRVTIIDNVVVITKGTIPSFKQLFKRSEITKATTVDGTNLKNRFLTNCAEGNLRNPLI